VTDNKGKYKETENSEFTVLRVSEERWNGVGSVTRKNGNLFIHFPEKHRIIWQLCDISWHDQRHSTTFF
jgi:hypothetical protein